MNEQARMILIHMPTVYVTSGTGLSGFENEENEDARAHVQPPRPPPHTPTHTHIFVYLQFIAIGSLTTYQILARAVKRFMTYGDELSKSKR